MAVSVLPSLPAESWQQLQTLLDTLSGVAAEFQVDFVDGQFVPLQSWPFTEQSPAAIDFSALAPYAQTYGLSLDCMVAAPEQYLDQLAALEPKEIIVHYGSTTAWSAIVEHAKQYGYDLGIAMTADVELEALTPYLESVDFIQVMGIAAVGQQGQPFDRRVLPLIAQLALNWPQLPIMVDGSVNETTIPDLVAAGATRLAPGSAIVRAADPVATYEHLVALANQ